MNYYFCTFDTPNVSMPAEYPIFIQWELIQVNYWFLLVLGARLITSILSGSTVAAFPLCSSWIHEFSCFLQKPSFLCWKNGISKTQSGCWWGSNVLIIVSWLFQKTNLPTIYFIKWYIGRTYGCIHIKFRTICLHQYLFSFIMKLGF